MSNVAFDQAAQRWAELIEKTEAARRSSTILEVRPIVARRLGVAPGSLERLRNGRVRGIRTWLYERIRALVIEELHSEIQRLEHELFVARAGALGAHDDEIFAAQAALAKAKEILREGAGK